MSNKFSREIIEQLSIDCLIFGFQDLKLQILLVEHGEGIIKGKWALPGGFVTYDENLDDAAIRILKDLTGVDHLYLEQLRAFGNVNRYPSKRVITIAYFALTSPDNYKLIPGFTASDAKWVNVDEINFLPYDHKEILDNAMSMLRQKVRFEPIGFNLLHKKFTLLELQSLYEEILNEKLDKPNFRRKIMNMKLLIKCDEKQTGVSHRAASLYRFDEEVYNRLKKEGYSFEF